MCKTRKKNENSFSPSIYRLVLVNPRLIITSARAGYTSVAARSLLFCFGAFTTLLCLKPADQRVIVSPSPESLKRDFHEEMLFIFRPLDLRCLVVEAAAEPMERKEEGEMKKRGLLRAVAVPAPLLCCCCPQRRRLRENSLTGEEEE